MVNMVKTMFFVAKNVTFGFWVLHLPCSVPKEHLLWDKEDRQGRYDAGTCCRFLRFPTWNQQRLDTYDNVSQILEPRNSYNSWKYDEIRIPDVLGSPKFQSPKARSGSVFAGDACGYREGEGTSQSDGKKEVWSAWKWLGTQWDMG